MAYRLSDREVKALEKAQFETDYLQGDFFLQAKLGRGVGEKTIKNLLQLGLIEMGYSQYHHEGDCVRITSDGERCLYGGLTSTEILEKCPEGKRYYEPTVKHWPVIEKGVFR